MCANLITKSEQVAECLPYGLWDARGRLSRRPQLQPLVDIVASDKFVRQRNSSPLALEEIHEYNRRMTSVQLYTTYREWAESAGEFVWTQRRLGNKLRERGFEQGRGHDGSRVWIGVGLRA